MIRSWFDGEVAEESDLSANYYYADLEDLIDFDGDRFDETLHMPRKLYRGPEFADGVEVRALDDVARYVTAKVPRDRFDANDYVTTESMVKDRGGIVPYEGDAPASDGTEYEAGDTLVSNIRPYLQKVWLADHDGACSNDVLVFRTRDANVMLPEFLHLLLWQRDFFDYDMSTFTGTGRPRGDKKLLLNYQVPTPDIGEQHELVSEFFRLTNAMSKLRTKMAISKSDVDSMFEEVFGRAQKEWPIVRLIECCNDPDDIKCGPFGTQLHRSDYLPQGVPIWGIPEVNSGLTKNPTLFISSDKAASLQAYSVTQGDVVVSRKGNVGQAALFREGLEPGIIHSDVLRIRTDKAKLNPEYLVHYLHGSNEVKQQIAGVSPGSIMPGTNVTKLKNITVACPPIKLQDDFADFAEKSDEKQAEIQQQLDTLSHKRDSLLDKYLA